MSNAGEHNYMETGDAEARTMAESNGVNDTAIMIGDEQEIAYLIQGKLCQQAPTQSECSIFRVPNILRRHGENAFVPDVISIGPFHHGSKKLQAMEKCKLWYLHSLLNRAPTEKTSLQCFVEAVGSLEQHCRKCYAEEIDHNRKKFVEMMVVDGCFIIQFLRKDNKSDDEQDKEDPVFSTSWMRWQIVTDLLLLENQLPWRVLDCLFNMTRPADDRGGSLIDLIEYSFPFIQASDKHSEQHKHLLDCLKNCLIGSCTMTQPDSGDWDPIPSAMELSQAGVKFKVGDEDNILNVTFKDGVLTIPTISIEDYTRPIFRNLIVFEQFDPRKDHKFTSYAVLLDNLVNSSKDVEVLKQEGILDISASKEDIASFLDRLYNDTGFQDFLYADVYSEVNGFCKHRWNRWKVILKRDYFTNPWTAMSVIAAVLLLGFSFLQTFYAVLSYYRTF